MPSDNYNEYNPLFKKRARELRKNSTKAEIRIWMGLLRGRMMLGYSFKRQRPIGRYIPDFVCLALKLVIEIDGATHEQEDVQRNDKRKDAYLVRQGFKVLRFTDEEVFGELDKVADKIEFAIKELERDE